MCEHVRIRSFQITLGHQTNIFIILEISNNHIKFMELKKKQKQTQKKNKKKKQKVVFIININR